MKARDIAYDVADWTLRILTWAIGAVIVVMSIVAIVLLLFSFLP